MTIVNMPNTLSRLSLRGRHGYISYLIQHTIALTVVMVPISKFQSNTRYHNFLSNKYDIASCVFTHFNVFLYLLSKLPKDGALLLCQEIGKIKSAF